MHPFARIVGCNNRTCGYAPTLVVALEIRFSGEFLVAVADSIREWIFALLVVPLHVGLEAVAPAEQLAAALDLTLEVGLGLDQAYISSIALSRATRLHQLKL